MGSAEVMWELPLDTPITEMCAAVDQIGAQLPVPVTPYDIPDPDDEQRCSRLGRSGARSAYVTPFVVNHYATDEPRAWIVWLQLFDDP